MVRNMPGAGGLVAANHFYNIAARDGTVIALLQRTIFTSKMLIPKNVNFDVTKMNWLGSLASEPGILMVWHTADAKTTADLFSKQVIVGGAGAANDSELTPKVLNAVIGTQLKVVGGYQSITAAVLAMERGEVQGVTDWSWSNAKSRNPQFLEKKLGLVLMQFALTRSPDLSDVPTPLEFAKSEEDKALLSIYFSPKSVSRPVALPPNVPEDRIKIMRAAFAATAKDPEFLADAAKSRIPVNVTFDDSVAKVIDIIAKAPPEIGERLRKIISAQ
jgi:tripartite-type tricarboxylate transporter receptor subunit TctC